MVNQGLEMRFLLVMVMAGAFLVTGLFAFIPAVQLDRRGAELQGGATSRLHGSVIGSGSRRSARYLHLIAGQCGLRALVLMLAGLLSEPTTPELKLMRGVMMDVPAIISLGALTFFLANCHKLNMSGKRAQSDTAMRGLASGDRTLSSTDGADVRDRLLAHDPVGETACQVLLPYFLNFIVMLGAMGMLVTMLICSSGVSQSITDGINDVVPVYFTLVWTTVAALLLWFGTSRELGSCNHHLFYEFFATSKAKVLRHVHQGVWLQVIHATFNLVSYVVWEGADTSSLDVNWSPLVARVFYYGIGECAMWISAIVALSPRRGTRTSARDMLESLSAHLMEEEAGVAGKFTGGLGQHEQLAQQMSTDSEGTLSAWLLRSDLAVPPQEVEIGTRLAVGGQGMVHRAQWRGVDVVVKRILPPWDELPQVRVKFLKEAAVWASLRHPKLVQLMAVTAFEAPSSGIGLITEFVARGSLGDLLYRSGTVIRWGNMRGFAKDVASAMSFLHASKIVHRDLKSHNVLITELGGAKVADFGISRVIKSADASAHTVNLGTVLWCAPELLKGRKYTPMIDVYAYGLLLYEIVSRKMPFQECRTQAEAIRKIAVLQRRPKLPGYTPFKIAELIRRCWDDRSSARPTFAWVEAHLDEAFEGVNPADPVPYEAMPLLASPRKPAPSLESDSEFSEADYTDSMTSAHRGAGAGRDRDRPLSRERDGSIASHPMSGSTDATLQSLARAQQGLSAVGHRELRASDSDESAASGPGAEVGSVGRRSSAARSTHRGDLCGRSGTPAPFVSMDDHSDSETAAIAAAVDAAAAAAAASTSAMTAAAAAARLSDAGDGARAATGSGASDSASADAGAGGTAVATADASPAPALPTFKFGVSGPPPAVTEGALRRDTEARALARAHEAVGLRGAPRVSRGGSQSSLATDSTLTTEGRSTFYSSFDSVGGSYSERTGK